MLTTVVLVRDEADHLARLLPELSFSDRILVVANTSDSSIEKICKLHGVRHVVEEFDDNFADYRNKALSKVRTKWAFFVDVDESVSEDLADEIMSIVHGQQIEHARAYAVRRVDEFFGARISHGELEDAWFVRLGMKGAGEWRGAVHEEWKIPNAKRLESLLIHYSHNQLDRFFRKIDRYAKISANSRPSRTTGTVLLEMLAYPWLKFLYTFILRLGFLDGWRGVLLSFGMSVHSFKVRWYQLTPSNTPSVSLAWRIVRGLTLSIFVLLGLGQLQRLELDWLVSFNSFELLSVALFVGIFSYALFRRSFTFPLFLVPFVIIFIGFLISFVVNIFTYMTAISLPLLYLLRFLSFIGFGWSLWWLCCKKRVSLNLYVVLDFVGWLLVVGGFVQYIFFPDARQLYFLGWDDHYYRMIGTIFDPGFLALLIIFWIILDYVRSDAVFTARQLIGITALGLTFARSGYVTLLAVLFVYLLFTRRFLTTMISIALLAAVIVFSYKPGGEGVNLTRTYSIESRVESSVYAFDVFMQHPVFGIGYNAYPLIVDSTSELSLPSHPSGPDTSIAFVLATSGLVGGLLWVVSLIWLWFRQKDLIVRLTLVALVIHSFANNSFFYSFAIYWFMAVMVAYEEENMAMVGS